MIDIITSIKVADALSDNIGLLFDGRGYDQQGFLSRLLLSSLARDNEITDNALAIFLDAAQEIFMDVYWLTQESKNQARGFMDAVKAFKSNKTMDNAAAIISYSDY